MDLCIAVPAVVVLSPVIVLIAIAIRLDSPGRSFFRQTRIGSHRRPFAMWKFRTMVRDASEEAHRDHMLALVRGAADQPERAALKLTDDPRVTRVGRWLRRTSLDELPQLFNVLRGEMSLVGPRPPVAYEYETYEPWQLERFEMPQGITGLWQVSGHNRLSYRRMHELDVEYVRNWSLRLDLKILAMTFGAVFADGEPAA